jgi:hypothetical protein
MSLAVRPTRSRPALPRCWADAALAAVAVSAVTLVAAPVLRSDLNPLERALSYYAVGPWGIVQAFGFAAMGVTSLALALALWQGGLPCHAQDVTSRRGSDLVCAVARTRQTETRRKLGMTRFPHGAAWSRLVSLTILLLVASGVASFGLIWYPMGQLGPASILGDAHQTAGTIAGMAQLLGTLTFSLAARSNPAWTPLVPPAGVALVLAVLGAVLTQAEIWWPHLPIPMGATTRLVVVPLVVFWALVGARLRRLCRGPATRSGAAT